MRLGRCPPRIWSTSSAQTPGVWEHLRGAQLFVTGGTGFFGRWMLESFLRANREFGLHARATLLTRDIRRAAAQAPDLVTGPGGDACSRVTSTVSPS